jgi:signal transduction histidine kinase
MSTRPLDRVTSIRTKLGAVIVFAVAATVLMMYIAVGFALRRSERDREFRQAFGEAQGVAALAFSPSGAPSKSLPRVLGQVPNPVLVVGPNGGGLVNTIPFPQPPNLSKVLSGQLAVDQGKAGDQEYLGIPVTRQRHVVGAVYLAYRVEGEGLRGAVSGTARFVRSVWWQFLLAGAVAAFIALFLARFLARGMTQPLRDMAQAARRMARGDYRQRVEVRTRDEVGQLADTFNRMAGEMENLERLRRDLVANVSHELKTPISAIRAHLENLLDGVEEPNPAVLSVMLQQSERLSRLIEQLLDLSRLESGDVPLELEPVQLAPLVDRVVREIEVTRPDSHVVVSKQIPADLPAVEADRERIHQVLFNLLDNAFRFTPAGGRITVRASQHGHLCEVSVEDTGPGIPLEHLPFVFERFYRVDPSRSRGDGGTGIGLAIARSVVEAHDGRIWVESTVGKGSGFRFVLPIVGPDQPPGKPAPMPAREEREMSVVGHGIKEET